MKRLFIVRHAKSSWDDSNLPDFERPLNKRGKRDAPFMGKLLHDKKIIPDAVISSPAVRALTTAKIFSEQLKFPIGRIIEEDDIYDSSIKEMEDLVQNLPNEYSTVFVFGHNPTVTSYCNHVGDKYIDNMPTCSIVGLELDIAKWSDVERNKGKTFLFEYPKKHFKK